MMDYMAMLGQNPAYQGMLGAQSNNAGGPPVPPPAAVPGRAPGMQMQERAPPPPIPWGMAPLDIQQLLNQQMQQAMRGPNVSTASPAFIGGMPELLGVKAKGDSSIAEEMARLYPGWRPPRGWKAGEGNGDGERGVHTGVRIGSPDDDSSPYVRWGNGNTGVKMTRPSDDPYYRW